MMFQSALWRTGWRYLNRHPWQSGLMILGIMLGVAVVVAVDLANTSASRAFDLSTQAVAGKATHQIIGGPQGLDERSYIRLKRAGFGIAAAPVISEYVSSPEIGGRTLQILGIDPFAEPPFRSYISSGDRSFGGDPSSVTGAGATDLIGFLTQPGAILLSEQLASRYGVKPGERITIEVYGQIQNALITGLISPSDELSRRALESLILADIATVQEMAGRQGWLDRIDLILPEGEPGEALSQKIQAILPGEVRLDTVSARSGTVEQMTQAFRVNLTALSLLALLVGMFLIYNTITFSVVQRRPFFGTLRCLGVTRREIFTLVIGEAFLVGVIGATLGLGLGILMGQGAVKLVTRTINDLFFVLSVEGVQIPATSLFKGAAVGILATLLSAAPPAWEAASVSPRAALSRSTLESKARRAVNLAAIAGFVLIMSGILLLVYPTRSLVISFTGTLAIVVGFAMLVPTATHVGMRIAVTLLGSVWGTLGRMAPRNVAGSLSRTSIAVMALMVAVSVSIGVSLMVSSFRNTVIAWLEETLAGDVYISAPGPTATTPSAILDSAILRKLKDWPGVERVDTLRSVNVDSPKGMIHLAATDNRSVGVEKVYYQLDLPEEQVWERMSAGAVIISEPLMNRLSLPRRGAEIELYTPQGVQSFPVIGVYYDYASTQGTILMALPVYQQLWNDPEITAIALRLHEGQAVDKVVQELQDSLASEQRLIIRANQSLRQEVLAVFDRTFAITGALQLLATVVAFIGILSALLSLELERQRELGILRSLGMTARQLWSLILIETGLLGTAAGILSMPAGYFLAIILVFIINRRSFGWTLQLQFELLPFIEALLVALVAALLAGLYPAWRMGRMVTSEALRSE